MAPSKRPSVCFSKHSPYSQATEMSECWMPYIMASQPARAASTGLNYVMYFVECECNCFSCLSSWQDNSGHFPSDILDIRKKHRRNLGDSGSCDWLRGKKNISPKFIEIRHFLSLGPLVLQLNGAATFLPCCR